MRPSTLAASLATVTVLVAGSAATASPADARQHTAPVDAQRSARVCPPDARALSYSDALDKVTYDGATLGGLSSLAYDRRSHAWASTVDNHGTDPARIWFFRDLREPWVVRPPLVLRRPDGAPYDGTTSDDEGLAVLPDGDYLVSSETEPSIRIFGRDGIERSAVRVPTRFDVVPLGQATANATLEGLSISPSGRRIVAAMEGALSGDSDPMIHRFLVYGPRPGGRWHLIKQVEYRTETGQRVPEVALLDDDSMIVAEGSFDPATGNAVGLYIATGLDDAPDVSAIADLATRPAGLALHTELVADLVRCPTLGAPAKETQANPLLDNFEGMAIRRAPHRSRSGEDVVGVSLISDDNFSATQTTRVLNLSLRLPST